MSRRVNESAADAQPHDLPPGLSSPARRALEAAGITRLEQLAMISEAELLKLHGMGPKSLPILNEALSDIGLAFGRPDESGSFSEEANPRIKRRKP